MTAETGHDWAASLAAVKGVDYAPTTYRRPDGSTATYLGWPAAILVVEGTHAAGGVAGYGQPHPAANRLGNPKGETIDAVAADAPAAPHSCAAADLLALAPDLPDPTPVTTTCDACDGTGKCRFPACDREHECGHCGGAGTVAVKPEVESRRLVRVGGHLFDARFVGRLLAAVPPGPVLYGVGPSPRAKGKGGRLRVAGAGWTLFVEAGLGDGGGEFEVVDFPATPAGVPAA